MTAIWKIWSELPRPFNPHPQRLGGKNAFWDRHWTLTEHISVTEHGINNRKEICQSTDYRDSPTCPPEFGKFGFINGWERFANFCPPLLNFCIGRHCQPYGQYAWLSLSQSLFEPLAVVCHIILADMHSLGSGSTPLWFWSWSWSCNLFLGFGLVCLVLVLVSWFDLILFLFTSLQSIYMNYKTNALMQ